MKDFFKNKTNVILVIVLLILVGAGTFLGIKYFEKPTVKAIDFSNMSEQEIIDWANENGISDKLEIKHNYDANVKEGGVVYFSVKEGDEIGDSLLIIISDGIDTSNMLDIPFNTNTTLEDLKTWFNDNSFTNVKYEYIDSEDYEIGTLISVEPLKANTDDEVVVKISGKEVDVPDFTYLSDSETSKWSKENSITIKYTYETDSKVPKGNIISQSIEAGEKTVSGSTITIKVSSGSESTNNATSKTATIDETGYLGKTETEFLTVLKNLGFTNIKKGDSIYSEKRAKDTICYYLPDGKQSLNTEIVYKLSLGKFTFSATDFEGKTEAEAKKLVADLKAKSAPVESLKTTETENSSKTAGTVYDCSLSSKTVSCKLAKGGASSSTDTKTTTKTAYIDPYGYLGASESSFLSDLKDLGFTNITKADAIYSNKYAKDKVCYYLPDGKQSTSAEIVYKLSLGKYTFSSSAFEGKTEVEAKALVADLKAKQAGVSTLTTTATETSSKTAGTVYDCSLSSSTVSCKLAKAKTSTEESKQEEPEVKSATILGSSALKNTLNSEPLTYDGTALKAKEYFQDLGFTNITVNGQTSDMSKGAIISISVNGSTSFQESDIKVDVPVIIIISNGDK